MIAIEVKKLTETSISSALVKSFFFKETMPSGKTKCQNRGSFLTRYIHMVYGEIGNPKASVNVLIYRWKMPR